MTRRLLAAGALLGLLRNGLDTSQRLDAGATFFGV
jgi:hypothetical protein